MIRFFEKTSTGISGVLVGIFVSLQAHIEALQVVSLLIGILIGGITLFLKIKQLFKDEN